MSEKSVCINLARTTGMTVEGFIRTGNPEFSEIIDDVINSFIYEHADGFNGHTILSNLNTLSEQGIEGLVLAWDKNRRVFLKDTSNEFQFYVARRTVGDYEIIYLDEGINNVCNGDYVFAVDKRIGLDIGTRKDLCKRLNEADNPKKAYDTFRERLVPINSDLRLYVQKIERKRFQKTRENLAYVLGGICNTGAVIAKGAFELASVLGTLAIAGTVAYACYLAIRNVDFSSLNQNPDASNLVGLESPSTLPAGPGDEGKQISYDYTYTCELNGFRYPRGYHVMSFDKETGQHLGTWVCNGEGAEGLEIPYIGGFCGGNKSCALGWAEYPQQLGSMHNRVYVPGAKLVEVPTESANSRVWIFDPNGEPANYLDYFEGFGLTDGKVVVFDDEIVSIINIESPPLQEVGEGDQGIPLQYNRDFTCKLPPEDNRFPPGSAAPRGYILQSNETGEMHICAGIEEGSPVQVPYISPDRYCTDETCWEGWFGSGPVAIQGGRLYTYGSVLVEPNGTRWVAAPGFADQHPEIDDHAIFGPFVHESVFIEYTN